MLWFIQCSRPIYKSELHATPHPTSLALGHLPPGGRLLLRQYQQCLKQFLTTVEIDTFVAEMIRVCGNITVFHH